MTWACASLTSPWYIVPGPPSDPFSKIASVYFTRPFTYKFPAFRKKRGRGGASSFELDIHLRSNELLAAVKSDSATNQNSFLLNKTNELDDFNNSTFLSLSSPLPEIREMRNYSLKYLQRCFIVFLSLQAAPFIRFCSGNQGQSIGRNLECFCIGHLYRKV